LRQGYTLCTVIHTHTHTMYIFMDERIRSVRNGQIKLFIRCN